MNVVTGETASTDQAGYVIEPGDYVNIQGWRKDFDRTAALFLGSIRFVCLTHRTARRSWRHRGRDVPRKGQSALPQPRRLVAARAGERRCIGTGCHGLEKPEGRSTAHGSVHRHRPRPARILACRARRVRARKRSPRPARGDPLRPSRESGGDGCAAAESALARSRSVPRDARIRSDP